MNVSLVLWHECEQRHKIAGSSIGMGVYYGRRTIFGDFIYNII